MELHKPLSLTWLLFIFLTHLTNIHAENSLMMPRLSPFPEWKTTFPAKENVKTFYYDQVLDHFNYMPESYHTFPQRYLVNFKHWGGANSSAPIFVYLGAEAPIDDYPQTIGFLTDNAASFSALLVYIEHRYYGKSVPFGSWQKAFKDANTLGYFNSAQAIADYAAILIHIKKTLHAPKSPVIVVGVSYGGSKVASQPHGLSILSQRFNTCSPLNESRELKDYLRYVYATTAQYNYPPKYLVSKICDGIDRASFGTDILGKIYAGFAARYGNTTCNVIPPPMKNEADQGWKWQRCSEMVMPIGVGNDTMFQPDPFNFTAFAEACYKSYGVSPRPHWITTYYEGYNIKLVLQEFGSNIIFSNGLKDPYSSGGVLSNISDSLVAIYTVNGAHGLDFRAAFQSDPDWLVLQRKTEVEIIKGWIKQYYDKLGANHKARAI